jgi:hypothetical protein
MATPMQFELLGKILWAFSNQIVFRPSQWLSIEDSRKTLSFFGSAISSGSAALVDAQGVINTWLNSTRLDRPEVVNADGSIDGVMSSERRVVELNRDYMVEVMRPHVGRDIYSIEIPWPFVVMVGEIYAQDGLTAWLVIQKEERWTVWPFAIGLSLQYGLWMGDISDRMGSLATETDPFTEPVNQYHLATAMTFSLASAKNAKWETTLPSRSTRRRHPSVAQIRFRHIDIDMGKPKSLRAVHGSEQQDIPWHHRRGHWAYYTPDRPLFGRKGSDGWYWRPYTEVGEKNNGQIIQDYSVKGNTPVGVAA